MKRLRFGKRNIKLLSEDFDFFWGMNIELAPEFREFVTDQIENGTFSNETEVLEKSLEILRRISIPPTRLNAMIAEGKASELVPVDENHWDSLRELALAKNS